MEYWDPLRRKNVAATPEEQVRQWFISELKDSFGVPLHLMMSETSFKFGEKRYRADILVHDRNGEPLCVVECKRPEVDLDAKVIEQAMRYDMVLSVSWIILTNGRKTFIFKRVENRFQLCGSIPSFEEMLCRR